MVDDPEQLAAQAKWCRRLARESLDAHVRASLEELAQECERRRQVASTQSAHPGPQEIAQPRLDQS